MAPRKKIVKLAVGDHVRLASYLSNQHPSYGASPAFLGLAYEPVDGLILSIRDIKTGKLAASTTGNLDGHVFELIYDATFSPKIASQKNNVKGVETAEASPVWKRLRDTLRKEASEGHLFSTAADIAPPVARIMDGWKVIKVRSADLMSLETEIAATTEASA